MSGLVLVGVGGCALGFVLAYAAALARVVVVVRRRARRWHVEVDPNYHDQVSVVIRRGGNTYSDGRVAAIDCGDDEFIEKLAAARLVGQERADDLNAIEEVKLGV